MTLGRTTVMLVAALALAGCANPDRFGAAGSGAAGGAGFDPATAGSASDPSSPAYFEQTIGDRVLFAVDEFTLSDDARATLAAQARWLTENGGYAALIEGHADERGTRTYNMALGSKRAAAVQNFLIEQGVAPGRLQTNTWGKERPIAVCSDESCYSQNRRAVTIITGAAGL